MKPVTLSAIVCLLLTGVIFAQRNTMNGVTVADAATNPDARANSARTYVPPNVNEVSYPIGPADVLQITVWKEPELSTTVPVRPDGKISLPLLNDLQAAGLSPMQLRDQVTSGLTKYVANPQVTVVVTAINSKRIYVMGEVNRPGPLALMPEMTVLQAISSAGGFSQFANQKKIYILRNENGIATKYNFNYKEALKGKPDQNISLKTGDTVVIP